jgi:hypothetical protein
MIVIVLLFVALGFYVFWLSFKLILMGVKGEFEITAGLSGLKLYFTSISPGLGLAAIMALILIIGLPKILHPKN